MSTLNTPDQCFLLAAKYTLTELTHEDKTYPGAMGFIYFHDFHGI